MIWYGVKILVSAMIIVIISEVSKRLPLLGSLIASLPLVSVLGMIWLYGETKSIEKIATHSEGTFWYVLPSLPMVFTPALDVEKRNQLSHFFGFRHRFDGFALFTYD